MSLVEHKFQVDYTAQMRKYYVRLATVGVTSTVTSSPTQQICLCGNELMRREVVTVT